MKDLIIISENPFAEVALFDHRLQLIDKKIGYLKTALEPGIYKVQFSAGNTAYSELIEFTDTRTIEIPIEKIGLENTTIPLGNTEVDKEQMRIIQEINAFPLNSQNRGNFFLFISSGNGWKPGIKKNHCIELVNSLGMVVHKFQNLFEPYGKQMESWCNGVQINFPEGRYRLRISITSSLVDADGNEKETTVVSEQKICLYNSFQTQFFFRMENQWLDGSSLSMALFPVSMRQVASEQYFSCELARNLMGHPEVEISSYHAERLAAEKWENPILGIYSALIMINQSMIPESGLDLYVITNVCRNTYYMLGNHPDLMVIAKWLQVNGREIMEIDLKEYTFDDPPMLKESWELMVLMSKSEPDLVPIDSLLALTSTNQVNAGAWYSWLYTDPIIRFDNQECENEVYSEQDREFIPMLYAKLIELDNFRELFESNSFSVVETRIIRLMDEQLPIQFLYKLSDLIRKKSAIEQENPFHEDVLYLMKFVTPAIIKLLRRASRYIQDTERKQMVANILSEIAKKRSVLKWETEKLPENFQQVLPQSYFENTVLSESLANFMNLSKNSIEIALNGIKEKLNLPENQG